MDFSADRIRWTVFFSGHVQGVGFRYTTRNLASGYAVTGYVRNTRDGRVEVVVEGASDEVQRFVRAVQDEMGGYVRDFNRQTDSATGEFTDFQVRH